MKKACLTAGLALALGCAAPAALAQAKPEQLIKQRQSAMTLQLKYFGPIAGMAQGKVPYNADVVARNAAYLETITKLAWDDFDPGTKGQKTRALDKIYDDQAGFKSAYERLQAEVSKLAAAAQAKDEAGVKAAFPGVGKACAACHDSYRAK
jgi:cytochrome c556